jgi:hypothetical protein
MSEIHRVVFVGNSLILASISATLSSLKRFDVIQISKHGGKDGERLLMLRPDTVLLELEDVQPEWLSALFEQNPSARIIVVDLVRDRLLALSSREYACSGLDALLHAICDSGPLDIDIQ